VATFITSYLPIPLFFILLGVTWWRDGCKAWVRPEDMDLYSGVQEIIDAEVEEPPPKNLWCVPLLQLSSACALADAPHHMQGEDLAKGLETIPSSPLRISSSPVSSFLPTAIESRVPSAPFLRTRSRHTPSRPLSRTSRCAPVHVYVSLRCAPFTFPSATRRRHLSAAYRLRLSSRF
jgi:hypothetical protein